jgi:DNA-binding response OmpR family regulator
MAKVLLAEDDPTMLGLLQTLLKMEGFEILSMPSLNDDVVTVVRDLHPDIVLLDVHLPRQNGMDVVRTIRESSDIADTKVVMSSGLNLRVECINSGADDFLLKPYMPDDLIRMLRRQLGANG